MSPSLTEPLKNYEELRNLPPLPADSSTVYGASPSPASEEPCQGKILRHNKASKTFIMHTPFARLGKGLLPLNFILTG
jgi:hypothetical protein